MNTCEVENNRPQECEYNEKNVTMSDIGKVLNVSTVTVSKALSNKEGVSQSVRKQIIEIAEIAEVAITSVLNKIEGDKKTLGRRIITSNIIYRDSVKNIK